MSFPSANQLIPRIHPYRKYKWIHIFHRRNHKFSCFKTFNIILYCQYFYCHNKLYLNLILTQKNKSLNINATGGSKTVTLGEANMPSHSHSFTPSGSFKMDSHKHSINGHTHSYTPEGSVSLSLSFKEMSGTIIGAGSSYINGSSSNEIFASASGVFSVSGSTKRYGIGKDSGLDYNPVGGARQSVSFSATPTLDSASASFSGITSCTGYSYDDTDYSSPSGTFSGNTGTTSSYGGDSNGNASSFNIMNPYITKYCWERID